MSLEQILSENKIIPVVEIHSVDHVAPLCDALLKAGLATIEITLRTPVALEAISIAASEFPQMAVGAGTILVRSHVKEVKEAGASFGVSPGMTDQLDHAVKEFDLPFLPGASSASEAMINLERGYKIQKFFPAEAAGGVPFLKSLASPLSDIQFCPTGGVNSENIHGYLNLPNVICAGGSWFLNKELMESGDCKELSAEASRVKASLVDSY